jgi:hypothetical protein
MVGLEINTEKNKYYLYDGISSPERRANSWHKIANIFWKCGTFQIFGNDSNRSKLDSEVNQEETEFGQCLLLFGPEPFFLSYAL